ncbi:MAG: MCE family protein [Candidatus Dormibacteraeota bacterium]|uniref:MCE family protein n=1 Tax=Candidatus Aeolococcus gillhamiae TaxID=3127015 RepID=A0A934JZG9_9BACT|nr:MCE family protein [Candidatus Dormibacteraeota bacterium]
MRRQPRVNPFWSGLVAAVVLVVAMVGVVVGGIPGGPAISLPWNHTMVLHVQLANADGLAPHASVDVAGVKVGEVHDVTSHGDIALATLNIDPQYSDIRSDAQVLLRPHGLFGPKYIEITPGSNSGQLLADGATINVRNTVQPVDLDQVLQALQAPEAQNLRTAIVELGKAAAGKGDDVNHLLGAAKTLTQTLQTPLLTLDHVSTNFNDFIIQNEAFNASFAQTPLDQLVASSNTTLAAFAANSAHLGSLLDHADSTLTTLDTALNGQGSNIKQTIDLLGKPGGTIDKLNTFNGLISLFAANLTGKEAAPGQKPSDVTQGIIAAIENIKSAFSSYDCSTTVASLSQCPQQSRAYYLRVQVFNLAGISQALQTLCTLPIPPLPGIIPLPALPIPCSPVASSSSRPGQDVVAGEYTNLGALIRS